MMSCHEPSKIMHGERKVMSVKGAESKELWDSMPGKKASSNHGTQLQYLDSVKYTQLCAMCEGRRMKETCVWHH